MITQMAPSTVTQPLNLKPGEEVYTVGSDLVTVGIARIPSPDPTAIVLELTGRKILPDGSDTDPPVYLPAHRHTVTMAALAGGTTSTEVIAQLKTQAFERWPAYLQGLTAFSDIPMNDTPELK